MARAPVSISHTARTFPASYDDAVANYPIVVLAIARRHTVITSSAANQDMQMVLVEDPPTNLKMSMPRIDFDILRRLALNFEPRITLFLTEPEETILARATFYVRTAFKHRQKF